MTEEATIPPDELPSEDPGADTQRRFRYQAAYAAIRALDLLRDDTGREELICEHFEDILLKRAEGTFTGIQVKTRAAGRTPFKATDREMIDSVRRFIEHEQRCPDCFSSFVIATSCGFWHEDKTGSNLAHLLGLAAETKTADTLRGPLGQFVQDLRQPGRKSGKAKFDQPTAETVLAVLRKTKLDDGPSLDDVEPRLVERIGESLGAANHALGSVQLAAEALINAMLRAAAQPGPESASVYSNPTPASDPLQKKRFNRAKVQRILQDALGPHAPLDAFTELRDSLDQQHRTTDEKLDGVLTRLDSLPRAPSAAPGPGIRMASVLRTGQGTLPETPSPAALLNARYEVVPFFKALRQRELEILDTWCREDHAASVRLLVGPGGTGKTRLLIYWSSTLRAAEPAWHAGFLPDGATAEDLDRLLADDGPTLIVVDYAESRTGLLDVLRRLAARPADARAPCRVVLLARDVGDWWLALQQQDADVADLLDRCQPSRLEPVPVKADLRRQAFEQAREWFSRFRAANHGSPPAGSSASDAARTPDLSDDRYGRVLYLHMVALAAVEGVEASPDRLLAEVLMHEARFWRQQYPQRHAEHLADADEFIAGLRRMVAAATLLGGLPSRDAVEALRDRVRGPGLASVPRFLHWLYPGRGEADRQAAWVSGLEPDLLGEALVARVLADLETPQDYLEQVFADSGETGLRNGFVVLGRIALWDESHGIAWLARLLEADVPGRARAAFDAALALGGHTALAPLGQVLAEALSRDGTPELAAELEPLVPWETVSLREVGLWAVSTLLDRLRPSPEDEAAVRERSHLLTNAGKRLSDLGHREEALQATAEAVEILRRLAAQRPDAFLPHLATSLNNLGNDLSDAGRREEALQATAEAVRLTLPLAERYPQAFLDDLRDRSQDLRERCAELDQDPDADPLVRQATELLARLQPGP